MKLKLTKAEQNVIDWIIQEWKSEWNTGDELEMDQDGDIDFKISDKTIASMVEKGILLKGSEMHKDGAGNWFYASFNPVKVLEAYCGVEFTKLTDPNGNYLFDFKSIS
jgi:hypothetical protein